MARKPYIARALLLLLPFLLAPTPVGAAEDIRLLLTTQSGFVTEGRSVDIFRNDDLDDRVLHPGSGGTFTFTVSNPEDFDVDFRLAVQEENLHGVPIEFSLVTGGETLVEDGDIWLSAEELADHEECLAAGAGREMSLRWRWLFTLDDERDASDTALGGSNEATQAGAYALLLDIYAEQSEASGGAPAGQGPGKGTARKATGGAGATSGGQNPATRNAGGPDGTGTGARHTRVAQTGDSMAVLLPAVLLGLFGTAVLLAVLRAKMRLQKNRAGILSLPKGTNEMRTTHGKNHN